MSKPTHLSQFPMPLKLMLLGLFLLLGMIGAGIFGILTHLLIFSDSGLTEPMHNYHKGLQVFNQLFIFLLPALGYCYLMRERCVSFFRLSLKISPVKMGIGLVLMLSSMPLVAYLITLNNDLSLPSFMSGLEDHMRMMEEKTMALTSRFLHVVTLKGLIFNLFVLAVVPSISEELLFRGVFQKILHDGMKRSWIPLVVSAFVFSFFHLQFYTFLPRFFLGFLLAFVFWYTKNLWYPIFMHFINNALTVFLYYLHARGIVSEEFVGGTYLINMPVLAFSIITTTALMYYLKRLNKNGSKNISAAVKIDL